MKSALKISAKRPLKKYEKGGTLTPFEKAFAEARAKKGPNATFPYKGKMYTTQYKEEVGAKPASTATKSGTSFDKVFAAERERLGPGKTFTYNGKQYSTNYATEVQQGGSTSKQIAPKQEETPRDTTQKQTGATPKQQVEDVSQEYPTFSEYIRDYKEANPNARLNSRQTIYKLQQQYQADMPDDYRKKVWEPQVKKLEKEKSSVGFNYVWDPSQDPVTKMIGSFGDITGIAAAANKVLGIKEIPELTQKQLINKSWQLGTFNVQPGYGSSLDYVGLGRVAKAQQVAEGVKQLGAAARTLGLSALPPGTTAAPKTITDLGKSLMSIGQTLSKTGSTTPGALARTGSELAKRGAEVGKYTSKGRSYNISGELLSGAKGLGEGMKTVGTGPKLKSGVKGVTDIINKEGKVIKSIYKYKYGGSLPKKQLGGMANVGSKEQAGLGLLTAGVGAIPGVGAILAPIVGALGSAFLQKKQQKDNFNRQYSNIQVAEKGGKINKLGVENSLWNNIRKKAAQNKKTGATPKKPTKEMLEQERKIKASKEFGGTITGNSDLSFYKGKSHRDGGIMVNSKGVPSRNASAEVEGGETRFMYKDKAYIFSDKLTV